MDTTLIYIIIFLAVIFVMFYFFMIRPQRKKQREHEELIGQLRGGARVITAGGIYGHVESISQDSVVLKIESGATMRVTKSSIVGKA